MADGIQGTGDSSLPPLSPSDRKQFEQEFKHGVDLFQRALSEYGKADEMNKKEAFREVMERAMQVINETAHELHRGDLEKDAAKISKDFEKFQETNDQASQKVLTQDLKEAKHRIH